MIITNTNVEISISGFKTRFTRHFPFVNIWDVSEEYSIGDKVLYTVNNRMYSSIINNNTNNLPTDTESWLLDSDNSNNYINDADIERAFNKANILINSTIIEATQLIECFMLLSAHYLALEIQQSLVGIGQSNGYKVTTSKSVGSISESYDTPKHLYSSLTAVGFTTTQYGIQYWTMIEPLTRGRVSSVNGATLP